MNASQVANRVLAKHRASLQSARPNALTLAQLLTEAAEAGYCAALSNMRIAEAEAGAAIATARLRSR